MCRHCPNHDDLHVPGCYAFFDARTPNGVAALTLDDFRDAESRNLVTFSSRLEEFIAEGKDAPESFLKKCFLRTDLAAKVKSFDQLVRSSWIKEESFVPEYAFTDLDSLSSALEVAEHLLVLVEDNELDLRLPQYLFQISRFRAFLLHEQAELFGVQKVRSSEGDGAVVGAKRDLERQENEEEAKRRRFVSPQEVNDETPAVETPAV
jgi:hypothetical protein